MKYDNPPVICIGSDYRDSRRLTSLLCAIGLGWSTALFELKSLTLGSVGVVDLSNPSVPFILTCGILYMTAKSIVGYAMQSQEVRRWHLAQVDFRILLLLVRSTLLMLAAGGLHRSVETIVFVAVGALAIVAGWFVAVTLGMFFLVPLIIAIRNWTDRSYRGSSPVSYVSEASAWTELLIMAVLVVLLLVLGFASLEYGPFLALWTRPPDAVAVAIIVVTGIGVIISFWLQGIGERKLFARPGPKLTQRPNGTIGVSFPKEGHASDEQP